MYRTNDPAADWDRYCAEQERELAIRPTCSMCGEHIASDDCYEINDELICPECLNYYFRKWTENYIEEK